MLEVYQFTSSAASLGASSAIMMKAPPPNIEVIEFNLGKAPELRSVDLLNKKLQELREWFPRLGDHSRKRFMLGLIQRLESADLLSHVVKILQPILCKDFTYSRSRPNPSLQTDSSTMSADRALTNERVEEYIITTLSWFRRSNYWTKANYALALLQQCDAHLLYAVGLKAKTLLVAEEKAALSAKAEEYMERESIASSTYSFHSIDHPELELLRQASPGYTSRAVNPLTGEEFMLSDDEEIINADSEDEQEESSLSSLDPAYMVIPTSSKAYSGVAKYCDFIHLLPVHVAKLILSMLDKVSLMNVLNVSKLWKLLGEEVIKEADVSQLLKEEVMLMQGAAAQGANPVYAKDIDVLVPNLYPGSRTVIKTEEAVIKTTFLSDVSFETAYSGISTRKVIMEERNVYCGAYNVMVLSDQEDSHRVIHTDGGRLIAIGSKDRKVRFIDSESGKEPQFDSESGKEPGKAPVITGHAGSVRCVYLVAEKEIVLSGSYDTSIRCWNIKTGQCLKIFRGHRDTVLTIRVYGDMMVSGSKDNSSKVWNMQTGKCQRTFRHRYPVLAVAMNSELCISGCEGGRVKVWDVKSGDLIKSLNGHMDAVNAIQFDRWHIITGSRDGYALVWSTQGDFNRCLTALKHPKEVLCLEFMYLRVITGSADGRIRVWNIMTGQCCRIMRGNSKSEPIHSIIAIGDRITLNTSRNLLVLNFEKVEWDYSLEGDKMPPLVLYGSYSEAPVRQQPYPYIRAQRMRKAGASNQKILNKGVPAQLTLSGKPPMSQIAYRAPQIPHSAKSLSAKSLSSARMIQTMPTTESGFESPNHLTLRSERSPSHMNTEADGQISRNVSAYSRKPTTPTKLSIPKLGKSRPTTGKSGTSQPSVTILDEVKERELEEWREPVVIHRRVSWAFEKPLVPKSKDISLSETKALLRSQMRMKAESICPPDFIYLTVNAIQNSMKPSETTSNTEQNIKDAKTVKIDTRVKRPQSSPSKIDPRQKIPSEEVDIYQLQGKVEIADTLSEVSEARSYKSTKMKVSHPETVDKEVYATKCEVKMLKTAIKTSLQPKRIRTTLPIGRIVRPISASVVRRIPPEEESQTGRPVTAPMARVRPGTAVSSIPSNIAASLPGATPIRKKAQCISITGIEANFVPMLMYPPDMKEKLASMLKERREMRADDLLESASEIGLGKVSPFNDPLRSHTRFELRTYEQEKEHIANIQKQYETDKDKEEAILEKKKKNLWTAKAKGVSKTRSAPVS